MEASAIRTAIVVAEPMGQAARAGGSQADDATRDVGIRQVAQAFETVFLKEMLTHAGLGESRDSFGGGAGEEGFASLLVQEHAKALSASGGIGLTEQIFDALKARSAQ